MTNTRTDDVSATAEQIKRLAAAGCEIVRVAVPDLAAARAVGAIRERSPIPLVADIHFDYRLALECVAAGCDKVRINPGNIGGEDRVKAVADPPLPPKGDSHPYRSQRRLPGEAHPGQIRRGDAGGPGGVGLWTYPPAGEI